MIRGQRTTLRLVPISVHAVSPATSGLGPACVKTCARRTSLECIAFRSGSERDPRNVPRAFGRIWERFPTPSDDDRVFTQPGSLADESGGGDRRPIIRGLRACQRRRPDLGGEAAVIYGSQERPGLANTGHSAGGKSEPTEESLHPSQPALRKPSIRCSRTGPRANACRWTGEVRAVPRCRGPSLAVGQRARIFVHGVSLPSWKSATSTIARIRRPYITPSPRFSYSSLQPRAPATGL